MKFPASPRQGGRRRRAVSRDPAGRQQPEDDAAQHTAENQQDAAERRLDSAVGLDLWSLDLQVADQATRDDVQASPIAALASLFAVSDSSAAFGSRFADAVISIQPPAQTRGPGGRLAPESLVRAPRDHGTAGAKCSGGSFVSGPKTVNRRPSLSRYWPLARQGGVVE